MKELPDETDGQSFDPKNEEVEIWTLGADKCKKKITPSNRSQSYQSD